MPAFEHCQTCIKTFHVPEAEASVVPEGTMCGTCCQGSAQQEAGLDDCPGLGNSPATPIQAEIQAIKEMGREKR